MVKVSWCVFIVHRWNKDTYSYFRDVYIWEAFLNFRVKIRFYYIYFSCLELKMRYKILVSFFQNNFIILIDVTLIHEL
jgi:hypothetical protein